MPRHWPVSWLFERHPEPCSLCSRLIPISEDVTIDQFESKPDPYIKHHVYNLAWQQAWKDVVDEVVCVKKGMSDILVSEGYRARSCSLAFYLARVERIKSYPNYVMDVVRGAVHTAYPLAVWRIANRLIANRGSGPMKRNAAVIEKAYICPDVDIKSDRAIFTYYAEWRRQ